MWKVVIDAAVTASDVSRLLHTPPTISPSSSSESIVAVYSSSRPSSPRHSHDTPSPAADTEATRNQVVKAEAEKAAPQASMEKDAVSLPSNEKANDSGTAATDELEEWDDHFCDPDAKVVIKSDDGIKFRASRWQLSQSS
jgi:hypothetical protein